MFPRILGPGGAPRGDCQEPRTGRDGYLQSVRGGLSAGRPSLGRTARPTGCDILVLGRGRTAGDCRGRWGTGDWWGRRVTGGDGGELTIEDGRERVRTVVSSGGCQGLPDNLKHGEV